MQVNFNRAAQRAAAEVGGDHLLPIVQKELLHYEILFALERANLLRELVFRGGAALRLCYGAPRLSGALAFAGGPEFDVGGLGDAKTVLERRVRRRFGLEAIVEESRAESGMSGVAAHQWWLAVKLAGSHSEQPRLRLRLEVANTPAYSREVRAQNANYSGLPDGYGDLLIAAESLDEVMADKLVSLAAGADAGRVRHRDIWDLRWLKQRGATVRVDWVARKLSDYGTGNYLAGLDAVRECLPKLTRSGEFREAMSGYLLPEVRKHTLEREDFLQFLAGEVQDLLGQVRGRLGGRGWPATD